MTLSGGADGAGVRAGSRAQSETIGFVLIFGMMLLGALAVVTLGATAVNDSQGQLSADRAEKVMTQLDSEISLVALGRTDSQEIDLDTSTGEQFYVDGDAGQMNVTLINETGPNQVVMPNMTLGAVVFERDDTVVAYQGGGVWRADGEGSSMVSPPEFNYRSQTLTLPLVVVSGDHSLNNRVVVGKQGSGDTYYPDATKSLQNPVEDGEVRITVESEYHEGWNVFFEDRTEGNVTHDPDSQRVTVNLTVPNTETFESGVGTTQNNGVTATGNSNFEQPEEGITADSVSPEVDDRIADCNAGNCDTLPADVTGDTLDAGTYYAGSGNDTTIEEDSTFDTSDGDIDVVVDGDLEFDGGGGPGVENQNITGDGQVTFYVKGNVQIDGNTGVNTDGDADDLLLLVHSDADEIDDSGTMQFTGVIYAPNSDLSISGGGACGVDSPDCNNIVGAAVVNTATGNGKGYLEYEEDINIELEVGGGDDPITFLHVSTNPVEVEN